MSSRKRGYASIWFLVFVALVCGIIGVTAVGSGLGVNQELKQLGFGLIGFSALAFFGGLVYEARRDLYAFCGVATIFLAICAAGALEAGFVDDAKDGQAGGFIVAGVLAALALASFVYRFRAQRAKDTLPDPLREQFKPGQIYEDNGVQFAWAQPGKAPLFQGQGKTITVVAQNCFDAERNFIFTLEQEGRISFNSVALEFSKHTSIALPPLAAGKLTIEVRAPEKAKGAYALLITPVVGGEGGARVRKPRAKGVTKKVSAWFFLLGHFRHLMNALRPRLRFSVKAAPPLGFDGPVAATALAAPASEILWKSDQPANLTPSDLANPPLTDRFGMPIATRARTRSPAPTAIAASILLAGIAGVALYKVGENDNNIEAQEKDAPGGVVGGVVGKVADAKPLFDAEKELKIVKTKEHAGAKGASTFHLVTVGLDKHERREFEMTGIPEPLLAPAEELMQVLSDSTVNSEELHPGDAWVGHVYGYELAAQIVEVKGNKAVLRIADVGDDQGVTPAQMVVAASAVQQARSLLFDQKGGEALALLRASLAWYPGAPGSGPKGYEDRNINQNDNLAWLLFGMLGHDVERSYQQALQRSDRLRSIELGGAAPPVVEREVLLKDARALVEALQSSGPNPVPALSADNRKLKPDISWQLGPVVSLTDGALTRSLRSDNSLALTYYYSEPAKSGLKDPDLLALAADIYTKYQPHPLEELALLREPIASFYQSGFDFVSKDELRPAPPITLAATDNTHLPVLSRILAALGRELAAGESLAEMRAQWGLASDAKARASAEKKMDALRAKED